MIYNPNQHSEQDYQIIRGVIEKITFHSPESGFSVMEVSTHESPLPVCVVGVGMPATAGIELVLRGRFQNHQKFGRQFKVFFWDQAPPSSKENLIKFLSSDMFPGIGEKKAEAIVSAFGMDALKIIKQHTYRLMEIDGIGKKKAEAIAKALTEHHGDLEIKRYLTELELTSNQINKIIKYYGDRTIEVLKTNPYQLAYDIEGFGFIKADQIGKKMQIAEDNPNRIKAGIFYALNKSQDDGHCFLIEHDLQARAQSILQLNTPADFYQFIRELEENEQIIQKQEKIYLKKLYDAETFIADFISRKIKKQHIKPISQKIINDVLLSTQKYRKIELSEEQKQAVEKVCNSKFLIITGGPGCGKTTVLRTIVDVFRAAKRTIKLAAPTGKAAQRLSEVCKLPGSTIHRLLRYDPIEKTFVHGIDYPLAYEKDEEELPLDLLIIDEASMIDVLLAKDLFSAISVNTTFLLVGDKDQLPSVGPGRVFADLLDIEKIPRITLKKVFRQSSNSSIITFAHQVNQGLVPDFPVPDGNTKSDTFFIPRKDAEGISKLTESLISKQIPEKFNIPAEDITVLSPMNQGLIGTVELNRTIQAELNPPHPNRPEVKVGDDIFRLGDRVCQRVNNYNIDSAGVFNGDQGRIIDIDPKNKTMIVELWDRRHIVYQQQNFKELSLSYVLSIHRSQGSEIPCVIMVLHDSQFILLERQLLYTGMTRAKKLLIIVGSKRAVDIACKKARARNRNTSINLMQNAGN